ncbi:MAG: hypothetical protein R3202_07520 [Candidatus Competibacterales bacterium]|nr:hypothetical protein [Candidatus Competibacterales bacterium]
MRDSEAELERLVAAARGIPPLPKPGVAGVDTARRLAALARWLRFWHEQPPLRRLSLPRRLPSRRAEGRPNA